MFNLDNNSFFFPLYNKFSIFIFIYLILYTNIIISQSESLNSNETETLNSIQTETLNSTKSYKKGVFCLSNHFSCNVKALANSRSSHLKELNFDPKEEKEEKIQKEIDNENKLFFGNSIDFFDTFTKLAKKNEDVMFVVFGEHKYNSTQGYQNNELKNLHMIIWEHWVARYIAGFVTSSILNTPNKKVCFIQKKNNNNETEVLEGNNIAFNSFYRGMIDARKDLYFYSAQNITLSLIQLSSDNFSDIEDENKYIFSQIIDTAKCNVLHFHLDKELYNKVENILKALIEDNSNYSELLFIPFFGDTSFNTEHSKENDEKLKKLTETNVLLYFDLNLDNTFSYFLDHFDEIMSRGEQTLILTPFENHNSTEYDHFDSFKVISKK